MGLARPSGHAPFFDEMMEFGWPWYERRWMANQVTPEDNDRQRAWRMAQPATRVSSLAVVDELTVDGHGPRLISLYQARAASNRRRPWRWLASV